jgi:hypothetical protein
VRLLKAAQDQCLSAFAEASASVETADDPCPCCGGRMLVQKSVTRRVVTIAHGPFRACETVRVCAGGCTQASGGRLTRRSADLPRLVPAGSVYGYDVEVFVGLMRFVHHGQREEIRTRLRAEHGLDLSSGEVSALALRFLRHLEALQGANAGRIRQALAADGGYPLHVDATGEDGRGTLFVAYAGWRSWVLGAWKLPTERADAIAPCLQTVLGHYGEPCAVVRDLGRAMTEAVREALAGLPAPPPVLACHQHFLRDIGTDLLKDDYDRLRDAFRNFGIRSQLSALVRDLGRRLGPQGPALRAAVTLWAEQPSAQPFPAGAAGLAVIRALAQWALDYAHAGRHQGFPFDRPYLALYERCLAVSRACAVFQRQNRPDRSASARLQQVRRTLDPLHAEVAFRQITRRMAVSCQLFDELRAVLRLDRDPPAASSPDSAIPGDSVSALEDIEHSFGAYVARLRRRRATPRLNRDERRALDLILSHLDRHALFLWGHALRGHDGTVRLVARTNNALEGFFHGLKHAERRRSGRKVLTQDFEGLPAAAALAHNLTRPDYVALVCGSLQALPERFSALDAALARPDADPTSAPLAASVTVSAALPLADRRLVRRPALEQRIAAAAPR